MRRVTIYLLVALLTFAIGIAANSVFDLRALFAGKSDTPPKVSEKIVTVEKLEMSRTELNTCGCGQESDELDAGDIVYGSSSDKKSISGGVLNGKARSLPQPVYPAIARAARASGTVVVNVVIDEKGCIISARAESGHPLLQNAAVEAARKSCFAPTRLSGQPVKVSGMITYNFVIQ